MLKTGLLVARFSFKAARWSSATIALLSLLFACVPGTQVLLMASLLQQLGSPHADYSSALVTLALIVVLVGLVGPLRSIRDFVAEIVQLDTGAGLQSRLADRASRLTPAEIVAEDLASQIEGHSRAIVDHISRTYADALLAAEAILGAIGVVITLARYSWVASVLTVMSIIPTLVIGFYVSRSQKSMWLRLGRVYRRERYIRETLSSRSALLELTAFGTMGRIAQLEKDAQSQICAVRKEPIRAGLRATGMAAGTNAILFGLALFAVLSNVGFNPTAVAAVYGVFGAVNAVAQGGSQISRLVQYAPTVYALLAFLDRPAAKSSAPPGWRDADIREIEMRDVCVSYAGGDRFAVQGASLRVSQGEMIAIVGKNGAGKTTLLNALLGLAPIASGEVLANGIPVAPAAQDWWLRGFGSMPQDYGKYEVTVEESVRLGRADHSDSKAIHAALRAARAADFVEDLRNGERTQLGEVWGGSGLSGGQWQRLALARVYLRDANVWILDEPSSAIDAETEVEIFDELRRTSGARATIIVSHRAWTLRRMDRIYVMEEGRIVEQGKFEELVQQNGSFAHLFREQTPASGDRTYTGNEGVKMAERIELLRAVEEVYGRPLEETDDVFTLGGSSLQAVELVSRFGAVLGHAVDIERMITTDTISAWIDELVSSETYSRKSDD
ncbi:ATP-binding cassette domain-containing protein [Protofrankia symbiont of Coriaria ruscifolia]|uniref:ATP-binding cassette domain-containing protein n=1 Tax=Protofrankia symbiont of Coriaria ruscifolia TaxID=1306542 RepID=UPI001040EF01|nr:ATP-binding cassette domain-containing protein [Protofrankia symbiont of Coriaria ruscifolia]